MLTPCACSGLSLIAKGPRLPRSRHCGRRAGQCGSASGPGSCPAVRLSNLVTLSREAAGPRFK
eukprot:245501-Hanusia_phi.AAC.1